MIPFGIPIMLHAKTSEVKSMVGSLVDKYLSIVVIPSLEYYDLLLRKKTSLQIDIELTKKKLKFTYVNLYWQISNDELNSAVKILLSKDPMLL